MSEVVLELTRAEAEGIAEALEFLADVDEGENTDREELLFLAKLVRAAL